MEENNKKIGANKKAQPKKKYSLNSLCVTPFHTYKA